MAAFALRFPPEEIEPLALRFPAMDDGPYLAAGAAAAARGHYRRAEFLLVCGWKSPRSRPLVAANPARRVAARTRAAFAAGDETARIAALLSLDGVGVPTGSALLHFAFPDRYPVLDVRALESLGVRGRSTYPPAFWLAYLDACRALAAAHGVTVRTLDKALWQFSREAAA